jgi:hypothetical protein
MKNEKFTAEAQRKRRRKNGRNEKRKNLFLFSPKKDSSPLPLRLCGEIL